MKLSSKDNRIIKLIKKLQVKKGRHEHGLFLIEGEKLIKEAIKENLSLKYLLYLEGKKSFPLANGEVYEVTEELMKYLSTTDSPAPFLAVAEIFHRELPKKASFLLVINDLQDPGNLGTIIRSAEAAGVDSIICSKNTVDLFNPKVVRSAMGSVFRQSVIYQDNLTDFLEKLKKDHWRLIMTTPYAERNFYQADYSGKVALFIGNEGQGLDRILLENNDCIKIPMLGGVESLNTAIATSIILYEIMRSKN